MDSSNITFQNEPDNEFVPSVGDWTNLLQLWNQKIFSSMNEEDIGYYPEYYPEIWASQCCFREGATEDDILVLEKRLETKLPVSYKNFLLASNGFTIITEYSELYGTDSIKWFIEENQDWADMWDDGDDVSDEKYFQYGEEQDCIYIRGQYMKTSLEISSIQDGYVYLLNPEIIDSRNEWEAWDCGTKLPGAYRYRSFWDMIQQVYQRTGNYDD
ncbi:SMI1/KNR4 family protein [Roseofilum casamattae]|uniref:SMI1/KNR4 family protein n=1 Tax=Roseofilum casamattae BLCC-M143 TaxID=3022442 RepID=A0ABT7BWJ4_9CYAN|nr:SMI1/KNR4 family protein [Roseofilum casamattae]MDJ1183569.1 SMI1/KNR4 family protein [Roseofilum casamattae BLCC-M143]